MVPKLARSKHFLTIPIKSPTTTKIIDPLKVVGNSLVQSNLCTLQLKCFNRCMEHSHKDSGRWPKPVLNWANVCSPNILWTLRRIMTRFLIELLVRRIWFGQSILYFILNWLVMRWKLRPELAADSMIENVG